MSLYRTSGRLASRLPPRAAAFRFTRQKSIVANAGRGRFNDLSVGGKIRRSTEFTGSLGLIAIGFSMSAIVGYYLWTSVLSPYGDTHLFGKVFDRVKHDSQVIRLLGPPRSMEAHTGDTTSKSRMFRNRRIPLTRTKDETGRERVQMRFFVRGEMAEARVHADMASTPEDSAFKYLHLYVDIPGNPRLILEAPSTTTNASAAGSRSLWGIKWGPKKH